MARKKSISDISAQIGRIGELATHAVSNRDVTFGRIQKALDISDKYQGNIVRTKKVSKLLQEYDNVGRNNPTSGDGRKILNDAFNTKVSRNAYMGLSQG